MNGLWGFLLGIVASLGVNELCDVSPWLARKIIPAAARRWTDDPERREIYTEAWLAIVAERPGKLFKLGTALAFLGGAVLASRRRAIATFLLVRSLKMFRRGVQVAQFAGRRTDRIGSAIRALDMADDADLPFGANIRFLARVVTYHNLARGAMITVSMAQWFAMTMVRRMR